MGRFDDLLRLKKTLPPSPVLTERFATEVEEPSEARKFTSKPAKIQTSKPANQQRGLDVNQQTSVEVNHQTRLPANQQGSKELKKFSSYLAEDSLKRLKRLAFETDRKDYEVLQEAVNHYLDQAKQ
jgi:hypothetical protein